MSDVFDQWWIGASLGPAASVEDSCAGWPVRWHPKVATHWVLHGPPLPPPPEDAAEGEDDDTAARLWECAFFRRFSEQVSLSSTHCPAAALHPSVFPAVQRATVEVGATASRPHHTTLLGALLQSAGRAAAGDLFAKPAALMQQDEVEAEQQVEGNIALRSLTATVRLMAELGPPSTNRTLNHCSPLLRAFDLETVSLVSDAT